MNKLCQYQRDFLSSTILQIAARAGMLAPLRRSEYTKSKVEEILKILESDCVCQKKTSCSEIPKDSNTPCKKHDWKEECYTHHYYEAEYSRTLWLCENCGLVTCLDPNRSSPSKNPNDTTK